MKNLLRDVKISTRVFVLVGLTALLMTLVVGLGLSRLNAIGKEVRALAEESIPLLKAGSKITFHSLEQSICLERAIQFGKHMAQDNAAKNKFEIERKGFLRHGQMIAQEIEVNRTLVERMCETHKTREFRDMLLSVDYELRNIHKEHADHQFSAERVLNLLSQGKIKEAGPTIQKITRTNKEEEHGHFEQDTSLTNLIFAIENFVESSTARSKRNQQTAMLSMLLFSGLILLLSISFGIFISGSIRKPLGVAVNIAGQIAAGDRDITIESIAKDETGQLLQAMYEMTYSINEKEKALRQANMDSHTEIAERRKIETALEKSEEKYRRQFKEATDGIFIADAETGLLLDCNAAAAELVGREETELVGQHQRILHPPEEIERGFSRTFKQHVGEKKGQALEAKVITKNGEIKDVSIKANLLEVEGRKLIQGVFRDVTERKRAQEELEGLNEQLESTVKELSTANNELKNFAHITAHDLKAPLRGIGILAECLAADYADKFNEEGRTRIDLLVQRSQEMYNQIAGILQFSEIGQRAHEYKRIDLNKLIEEIITSVSPPENIQITIADKLPTLVCVEVHLTQVFQNLLSNAINYMDKADGQVTIGCVADDDFWKFNVTDNGRGIEEEYFDKIFQIFQTLAVEGEHKGTGIGLAIVRKAINTYGGKIWVESTPGQGTTFFFTFPKQEMKVACDEKLEANIVS